MTRWLFPLLIAMIALQDAPAAAQGRCGDRNTIVGNLSQQRGEARRGFGMANGVAIEVWASSATGTFTILQSYPSGVACVVARGWNWQDEDWRDVELQKEPKT